MPRRQFSDLVFTSGGEKCNHLGASSSWPIAVRVYWRQHVPLIITFDPTKTPTLALSGNHTNFAHMPEQLCLGSDRISIEESGKIQKFFHNSVPEFLRIEGSRGVRRGTIQILVHGLKFGFFSSAECSQGTPIRHTCKWHPRDCSSRAGSSIVSHSAHEELRSSLIKLSAEPLRPWKPPHQVQSPPIGRVEVQRVGYVPADRSADTGCWSMCRD